MSNVVPAVRTIFRRRTFIISMYATLGVLLTLATASVFAVCSTTSYFVTSSAPPPIANWTQTSGLWQPFGGFPGCAPGDSATDTNFSPTTIIINSPIPNPIAGMNFTCSGCVVDIQPGGSLTLAGNGNISNGAQIKVSGGSLTIASGGALTVQSGSTFSFTGGSVDVQTGGALNLNGTNTTASGAVLSITGGTMTVGGTLDLVAGTQLNLNGGSIGAGGTVNVGGVANANATFSVNSVFNLTTGATGLYVNSGTLHLNGGGNADAPISISGGATLDFPTGTYSTTPNGVIGGSGILAVTGGQLTAGGVTNPDYLTLSAGTLDGGGFLSVGKQFDWSGGTIAGNGGAELAGAGIGNFTGANGQMTLSGRTFNDYGYVNFTATTNELYLTNGATLSIYGTFDCQNDGEIGSGSFATNTVNVAPNGILKKSGGTGTSLVEPYVTNTAQVYATTGTLEFSGGGMHTGSFYAFNGSTLRFSNAGTTFDSGSSVSGDGTIDFTGSANTLGGSYDVAGTTVIENNATVLVNAASTTHDFTMTSGTLTVNYDFTMTGTGTWSGGTIGTNSIVIGDTRRSIVRNGTSRSVAGGEFHVDSAATLTIDGVTGVPALRATTLSNAGTVRYTSTVASNNYFTLRDGSLLLNDGVFDIRTDAPILSAFSVIVGSSRMQPNAVLASTNTIDNAGTFEKSFGTGVTDIQPLFTTSGIVLAEAGTMNFSDSFTHTAGTTTLGPGNIQVNGTMQLSGGVLNGAGTITGNVQNDAEVAPGVSGIGTIAITGNYTQSSTGVITAEIGGTSQFDQVSVSGTATLDGTFQATLINGYQPPNGQQFPMLTFASRTGAFATETLPAYGAHGSFTSSYTPTSYVLTAVVAPSVADLAISKNGPTTVNAASPLSYTINVVNNGPDPTTGTITVVDTLPAGVTAASASGSGWTCGAPSGGTITCTNATILASSGQLPTLTVTMTAPVAGGSITNNAAVSSSLDTNSANNTASASTTVVAQADLVITKSGAAGVVAGQNVTYTIVVTNNGPSDATSVVVSDPAPANLTFVSNSGACSGNFPCSLGTLTNGQSVTITSTYSTSANFSGNVTNTASVSSTTADPNGANNSASATTNVGAQADLSIVKTGPASTTPGQTVVYTIVVTNNGPSPATSTVVNDATPTGIAFNSNSGACTTAFPCSLGTLASGQSATITSTYTVPNNYSSATIVNSATASSAVNDPTTANNTSMVSTTVAQTTDLQIAKSGPSTVTAGQNIVYTITVTNLGPSQAASVIVNDNTPAGLTFVSNTGACTGAFPCSLGTLNAGQTATITSTFNVPANYSGSTVTNTANVSTTATDSNPSNNSATTTATLVAAADLSIAKSGPASFTPGQTVTYTVVVTNNGSIAAANTFVSDATPTGLTFVGNSGACSTPYPCSLGTIASGQSATITSTYFAPSNLTAMSVTNTANVSSSTADPNTANNTSSVTTPAATQTNADIGVTKSGPTLAAPGSIVKFAITVFNNGPATASNVVVNDTTPPGLTFIGNSGACTTPFPCTIASLASQQIVGITASYRVDAPVGTTIRNSASASSTTPDPVPQNNQGSTSFVVGFACPADAPVPIAPASDAIVASPVTFSWNSVPNAKNYVVTISRPASSTTLTTAATSITTSLPPGTYTWSVAANADSPCVPRISSTIRFIVCGTPTAAPVASVVGETATGQTYTVSWTPLEGVTTYELQEASGANFVNILTTSTLTTTSKTFTKNVTVSSPFHYRVRGLATCGQGDGPFSIPISIVVLPVPVFDGSGANVNVPDGSTRPVTFQLFVPGIEGGSRAFVASVDKPWLAVTPTNGIVPPEGINLLISADPTELKNGTWTGTVLVIYGSVGVASTQLHASASSTSKSFPVSISLVTPVTPVTTAQASASAVVIPSVGHLPGFASTWRSDVRIANISSAPHSYQLTFNNGSGDGATPLKKTNITIDAGATTALDDIVRNWYGIGSLDDSANGLLTIEQLDSNGAPSTEPLAATTVVSSRTYNTASEGTLGQFIPAVPFANFIGRAGGTSPSVLSLQQLTQSENFRTNLGVVEASGKPVNLILSVFNAGGTKVLDLPLALKGGEQKQLNSVLATNGITSLTNGRVEARVASGDGKATAYASVVDNRSNDPLLVTGEPLGGVGSTRFVLAGIADLATPLANWRSDVRLFNAGAAPQNATLTFYPLGNAAASVSKTVTVNPGEVLALDNVLQSTFGVTNTGGALHATTSVTAPLVVTARTYDETATGTRGQFIPAVTTSQAVGNNERALNILQVEESVRYRTNLGIAEVTGKPAIAEVTVSLPDTRVSPRVQIPLGAYESLQLPIISSFGIGATYNARISVRVVDGEGKITAYGSVIDMKTQDPTYVPAQ